MSLNQTRRNIESMLKCGGRRADSFRMRSAVTVSRRQFLTSLANISPSDWIAKPTGSPC